MAVTRRSLLGSVIALVSARLGWKASAPQSVSLNHEYPIGDTLVRCDILSGDDAYVCYIPQFVLDRDLALYAATFPRQLDDFNRAYMEYFADAGPGAHSRTELSAAQRSPGPSVDGA